MRIDDLPTPALLLDLDVLERNVRSMQERADRLGVRLRPHLKTHKCPEVARMQLAAGASGVTAATLPEARAFLEAGITDVTWAFPVVPSRIEEAAGLDVLARDRASEAADGRREGRLRLVVDGPEAIDLLESSGHPFHSWLAFDSGDHREGVSPASGRLVELARRLAGSSSLTFDGLLTHGGQAYAARGPDGLRAAAEEEREAALRAAGAVREAGIATPTVSVGSTPGMAGAERMDGVDEVRPGNYVFHDRTQVALGACRVEDCALTVAGTVISAQPGADRCVVDAGALALSKDPGPAGRAGGRPEVGGDDAPGDDAPGKDAPGKDPLAPCMGRIFEDADAYRAGRLSDRVRLVSLSQEHGVVDGRLPWGTRVRILPNHSCLVTALFDEYAVVRDGEVVDRWPIRRER